MKRKPFLPMLFSLALLGGCSANLKVYDENNVELKGIAVRAPILVTITTATNYDIAPNIDQNDPNYAVIARLCQTTTKQESKFLPLGEISYINYEPAKFAKSEFSVEYYDSGSTKSVSVNSDPAATAESAANLLSAALPLLQSYDALDLAAGALPLAAVDLEALRKSSCIQKSTQIQSIVRQAINDAPSN